MGVLWDKIWRDLWENKGRTLQVVLIIAVGTFAIGMIVGTRQFMITGMQTSWQSSSPATIYLWAQPGIDDDALAVLGNIDGVTKIEGLLQQAVEWRLSPDDPWQPAGLSAREDYTRQKLANYTMISGEWPHKKVMAVGQGGDTAFGVSEGMRVYIRVGGRESELTIGGVLYDMVVQPPSFGGSIQFYTTREQYGHLTGSEDFTRILASTGAYDATEANAIADEMQDKLEKQDVESGGYAPVVSGGRVTDPTKHFFQDPLDGLFFIMGLMAVIALILGLFLQHDYGAYQPADQPDRHPQGHRRNEKNDLLCLLHACLYLRCLGSADRNSVERLGCTYAGRLPDGSL